MILDDLKKTFGSRTKALEIVYLIKDLKPVVRQGFYENELAKVKEFCEKNKLAIEISTFKILTLDSDKPYSNKGLKVKADDPAKGMFFVYISKDERKAAMASMFELKNDYRGLGLILGYPECCVSFFVKNEPERSRLDNDYAICTLNNSKLLDPQSVRYPFFTNIAKRDMDIVLINHFPCSFTCEKSIAIAKKNYSLISEIDPNLAMHYVNQLKTKVLVGDKFVEFY
jgi:hypothetical protein